MKPLVGKVFTGQRYIEDNVLRWQARESVACAKCGKPIGLRTVLPEDSGLAWFDPYRGNGKYVHRECLSGQRQSEIANTWVEHKPDVVDRARNGLQEDYEDKSISV